MNATDKARQLLGSAQLEQLQAAGIQVLWEAETAFLLMAANSQDQLAIVYRGLDQIQEGGIQEGQAMKETQIRKVEERESRKVYKCQCGMDDCQQEIQVKERYIRIKLVEKLLGERKNAERCISLQCHWYSYWKAFLK